jgi:hypothetical protein
MASATPGGARVRPATVTYACYLLYLLAALQVISAIVQFSVLGAYSDVMKRAFENSSMGNTVATTTTIFLAGAAVIGLLFAAAWVVLAILDSRGKQAARIVTWVLLGLSLCCGGYGLVGNATGGIGTNSRGVEGAPSQSELQRMLTEALPGWYQPTVIVLGVLGLIATIAAIILLALPASNQFFRKQEPAWEPPPTTPTGQPGEPAAPPQPDDPPVPPVAGP